MKNDSREEESGIAIENFSTISDKNVKSSEEVKSREDQNRGKSLSNDNKVRKPEVVTKTVYKTDFPIKKPDCAYKSVNQRLREREFSGSSFSLSTKPDRFQSKLQQPHPQTPEASDTAGQQKGLQQILTTDKGAEEQRQKALERQREHEKFLQHKRSLLEEPGTVQGYFRDEDSLIGKQHALEYQSQTLEARLEGFEVPKVREKVLPEGEKREAETQTQQETKSTQCGTDELPDSQECSLSSVAESPEYFGSPKKEVETQTQGETKSTQCGPDDLAETFSQLKTFFRQKNSPIENSPRREVEVQTEQESKSIQCSPEDVSESSHGSLTVLPRSIERSRKEAEVQTYQESKGTQFASEEELLESPSGYHLKWQKPPEYAAGTSPIIVLVDGRTDMTVTHSYKDKDGNVVWAKHWGPERLVEIYREPKSSLGLSIVGGKVSE